MCHRPQARRERPRQRLRLARELVDDSAYAFAGEERDRAFPRRYASLHRKRFPGRASFVFGEAEGVLAWIAERGAVDAAGPPTTDVANHQLQGAADRRVGPIALA